MNWKNWLREPLVHFLIAGAALFAFFAWQGEPADPASRSISITQEDRARLALQWQQTMQRPPTDAELDSLTEVWLREEILYREALRLGLDQGDAVVRKRLANKMDFLASSIAETAQPSDETLEAWLADNPQRFAEDARYSFDQVYFDERPSAEEAINQIKAGADWRELGEVIALPTQSDEMSSSAVENRFGLAFTDGLAGLQARADWQGPIPSGFGWHLVRVRDIATGEVPPLEDIRERVETDWRTKTSEAREDEAYQVLRDAYDVTVER